MKKFLSLNTILYLGILQILLNLIVPNYVKGASLIIALVILVLALIVGVIVLVSIQPKNAVLGGIRRGVSLKMYLRYIAIILVGLSMVVFPFAKIIPKDFSPF